MPKMPSISSGRAKSSSSKLRRREPGGSAGVLTIVLVVFSLVVFTLSVREGETGFFGGIRSAVQTIVSPIRLVGAYATAPFAGMSNVMRNLTADEQTLSELKDENDRLVARNVELEEAEQTARRLEDLLELRNNYNLQSLAARVISGSTDSWVASVSIDKGSSSGVTVGMPVANATGAIGQVISCSASTSIVRLLTDEGSSVSAMVQSSRAQGMLEGSTDGTLRLALIRTDQTVNVGDVVVTSGLGGVFPKGLPVGKVSSVEKNPGSTYYTIQVEPFSHPEQLEEVLVITSLTEAQQATSEDIDAADSPDLEAASGRSVASNDEEKDEQKSETEAESDPQGTTSQTTTNNSATNISGETSESKQTGNLSNRQGTTNAGQNANASEEV